MKTLRCATKIGTISRSLAFNACIAYNAVMSSLEANMTTLTIRKVDPGLRERLRVRAARNGHSMEAELRCIISDALSVDREHHPNLAEAIRQRFAPYGGVELEPHPGVPAPAAPSFE